MLLRLFKGNSPGIIFIIAAIFTAVWMNAFVHPSDLSASRFYSDPMPLYGLLMAATANSNLAAIIISFLMAALISFLLVNFNTASFFINERTYLPALLYVLTGGLFPEYQSLNPSLPAALFLMLAIIRIMDGYKKAGVTGNFFDAAILISTGSLFYASLIWFGLLVIIGITLIRTVTLSEIAIALLGLLTPYLISFGLYYVIGKDLGALVTLIGDNLFDARGGYAFPALTLVSLGIATLITLISMAFLFSLLNSKKIKSRKTFSLLIWAFLISVAVYLIMPAVSVEIIWISAIPVSYFLTHYFLFRRQRLMPEISLSLLFLLVLIMQVTYKL